PPTGAIRFSTHASGHPRTARCAWLLPARRPGRLFPGLRARKSCPAAFPGPLRAHTPAGGWRPDTTPQPGRRDPAGSPRDPASASAIVRATAVSWSPPCAMAALSKRAVFDDDRFLIPLAFGSVAPLPLGVPVGEFF